ncbi:unnamed protein product [Phyllotreta striolata]|uniref:RING-type domain-containing protein n=1 Tax=Phyllotreta striolata TaxID=444603 RepID=A0A9N9XGZ2_PHYSR|nr:unnamed protein product [Phyllotreta striolata]
MEDPIKRPEKIKLAEINSYLTCYLCKGYLIDATTISECLHSFCRSCIIKFLQENSYCPICEVIINKAKPNLKLDKTLQDIVYKLVPELFLREMSRRKQYYQQYPQIAAKVSPEERGEDTERTIFNPQDCISLSLEYVSADSSPGAIKLLGSKNGSDKNDPLSPEDSQALMKRYLQCPGMCRVDVLKKFVRNKYNVDTTLFHIDILYKRVPLPDHYTLIDIAYIYSWKRNEPMKFFFRITDINKVSERFDYFDSRDPGELIVQFPLRNSRSNGTGASKKKEHALEKKKRKQESIGSAKKSAEVTDKLGKVIGANAEGGDKQQKLASNKENVKADEFSNDESPKRFVIKIKKDPEKDDCAKTEDNSSALKTSVTNAEEAKESKNSSSLVNSDDSGRLKTNGVSQQSDVKNSVYTNITLNRTNNMEIITKIQKVSNKEGQPIGLNIIEQTYKANDTPKPQTQKPRPLLKYKPNNSKLLTKNHLISSNGKLSIPDIPINPIVRKPPKPPVIPISVENDEKLKFLQNLQLMSKEAVAKVEVTKRKTTSPSKSGSPKKVKIDKKPVTRIILQSKPKPNEKLQSLIENCKIPSSLSITLKETSAENNKPSSVLPPVKNYIEILKLPDDTKDTADNKDAKLGFGLRMNDDSEQKVDEDLAEIAKSLTEKIPMSTTVSQIVGPKPEFTIPVKTNVPAKFNIQPSPVPELTSKLLNVPKDNKLNPRSPQSFQKIFEESIKKPDQSSADATGDSTTNNASKRNIVEIASQLQMKAKPERDKSPVDSGASKTTPKVAIPRLPHPKNLKTGFYEKPDVHQTLTNLHSNALGLNYTVSVGPKANGVSHKTESEIKTTEVPVKSPLTVDTKFPSPKDPPKSSPKPNNLSRNISPNLNYNSPRNSPKHSPKSSPMIKHMYAPTPMEQLRINTFTPKSNSLGKTSPSLSKGSPSPTSSASPKPSHSGSPVPAVPLNPNQILERFNIQNLAQLAKNLNFHAAANFGANTTNQLSALQHAMLLKHFEMQNRQNWLNMNQSTQYEKYLQNLQNLKTGQN